MLLFLLLPVKKLHIWSKYGIKMIISQVYILLCMCTNYFLDFILYMLLTFGLGEQCVSHSFAMSPF
jgi:hypothetical protein